MQQEFRSPANGVRVFQRATPKSAQLVRTAFIIPEGEMVTIEKPETLVYDHRDQLAVQITDRNSTYYVLMEELCPASKTS